MKEVAALKAEKEAMQAENAELTARVSELIKDKEPLQVGNSSGVKEQVCDWRKRSKTLSRLSGASRSASEL